MAITIINLFIYSISVMREVSEDIENFGAGKSALLHISNCEVQV